MSRRWSTAVTVLLAGCGGDPGSSGTRGESPAGGIRVLAGPEIRVSREEHRPHTETLIAANPRDVNNLIATSMATGPRGFSAIVFASHDGGNTWTSYEPPRFQLMAAGDPLIAFGPSGSAYFLAFVSVPTQRPDEHGRNGYDIYRSDDGGTTWALTQPHAFGGDHPWMAMDHTSGRMRGNLYVAAPGKLFRSTNGRTITDTFALAPGFIENGGVVLLSDASVVVALRPDEQALGGGGERLVTVTSPDGGRTWSAAHDVRLAPRTALQSPRFRRAAILQPEMAYGMRAFAADTATRSAYRDRLYVAWADIRENRSRIFVSASADRGRTWTAAAAITPDERGLQFLPTVAVNKDGVLGVLYCDTRAVRGGTQFNVWFTASLDGGATFLKARQLSSQPSAVVSGAHGTPLMTHATPYADSVSVWMTSVLTKHPTGGDYLGLAADVAGVFHPLWVDSRSGVYHVYTSRVELASDEQSRLNRSGVSDSAAINDRVTLSIDVMEVDSATGVVRMPVRLRNISGDTIWGPITIRIRAIRYRGNQPDSTRGWRILNAHDGRTGVGATFDYTSALGDLGVLPPGAISSALEWRAVFPEMRRRLVRLQIEAFGGLRRRP